VAWIGVNLELVRLDGPVWVGGAAGEFDIDFSSATLVSPSDWCRLNCAGGGSMWRSTGRWSTHCSTRQCGRGIPPPPGIAPWALADDAPAVFPHAPSAPMALHRFDR
jgi:hypothetical protein